MDSAGGFGLPACLLGGSRRRLLRSAGPARLAAISFAAGAHARRRRTLAAAAAAALPLMAQQQKQEREEQQGFIEVRK